ncbi:MAG TPA: YetF domain-containing protein, partial [Blastocatellia bacterium]|nr:YetF domain-containing protein [Blastocatellia bacterium]
TEGAVLISTIAFWDYTLDWLGYRYPRFQRFIRPAPLLLVKDGRMLRKNMRYEMITEEELFSQLRQQGVDKVSEVKKCYLEGDGRISVITNDKKSGDQGPKKDLF